MIKLIFSQHTKTIVFKSGIKLKISDFIAQTLSDQIIAGCKTFQVFTDEKNKLNLIINVSEIAFIQ